MESLNIIEKPLVDETIESFQYREYDPQNPQAVNNQQAIQIDVQNQDIFTMPSKSYLYVEGRLQAVSAQAGDQYARDAKVALVNNAVAFLFSQIRYLINNIEIENLMWPGQATLMKGLLTYPNEDVENLNFCWAVDSDHTTDVKTNKGFKQRQLLIVQYPNPTGSFSFAVPLSHLFGFCDDYRKILYGVKHSLILSRQSDNDAIYRAGAVGAGKIMIKKLSWIMPHIIPSLEARIALEKVISEKTKIPIAFRSLQCDSITVPESTNFSWRLTVKTGTEHPRYIIIGFQTDQSLNQEQNVAVFKHLSVHNIFAVLNSDRYPMVDSNYNFAEGMVAKAYREASEFKKNFHGCSEKETSLCMSVIEFIELYPIYVVDIRHQSERLKTSIQDIVIKVTFSANVPANTTAYALLISDRLLYLQSDGVKFQVMY